MGRQGRKRSWTRLFVTTLLAGVGLATLRTIRRPASPAGSPAPAAPPRAAVGSEQPNAAQPPTEALSSSPAEQPATAGIELTKKAPAIVDEPAPVPAPAGPAPAGPAPAGPAPAVEPELAAIGAGAPTAFVPDAAPTTPIAPTGGWETQLGSEWLPGFGAAQPPAGDPWTNTEAPAEPTDVPDLGAQGVARPRTGLREWANQTPRSQIIIMVIGGLCLLAAIVVTVVVLAS